jgi:hypothetical protein
MNLRPYQETIRDQGAEILRRYDMLYLAMQVRTGKTITSMAIAEEVGAKDVLFITKKKALSSVQGDYDSFMPPFRLHLTNWGSEHKATGKYDLMIIDEAHGLGAFPKPSGRVKNIKEIYVRSGLPQVILLSGTPTPESYSQIYHQVSWIIGNPFMAYPNFYKFAKDYVRIRQFKVQGLFRNDYSDCDESAIKAMEPYTISYTQQEAGFSNQIIEQVITCAVSPIVRNLVAKIRKDKVIELPNGVILGDTGAKLMSKVHQLWSGTIKYEDGTSEVLDYSKAECIKTYFINEKIGIFYKFVEELNALKQVFGDQLTTDIETFNTTDKNIALQIVSGREGISLKNADALVYYNIDFSANSYWQSRDRMTTIDRKESKVYWVFSVGGIEHEIYKTVLEKKDFTIRHFNKFQNEKV